ncbi:unnamed protein product [Withania somnifera]
MQCSIIRRHGCCSAEENSSISLLKWHRSMTTIIEKHKILSKVLLLLKVIKQEPQQLPTEVAQAFELYKDHRGMLWCGMTKEAEHLVQEEESIIEQHSHKAAEFVTRMLMMSVDKRLALDKISHFRRDLGLPIDFRNHWVRKFTHHFRVVQPFKPCDESEYLELAKWKSCWAMTNLERQELGVMQAPDDHVAGPLSLSFPMKFPPNYKQVRGSTCHLNYATELKAGTLEFNKRAVAVMHELLSFTIEKRLVTDYLAHFRKEFVMPPKLMRLKGKGFHVFLNSAYDGSELIDKHPLIVWREKVLRLVGYRKKKETMDSLKDLQEFEDDDFLESESENINVSAK